MSAAQPANAPPNVLASIRPLHSIVAAVMGQNGTPELLLSGNASPHSYALKPSDARKLERADIVFWIGPEMETFLRTPLNTLAADAQIYALSETPGLTTHPVREGGLWDEHDHGTHDHAAEDHDAHEHDAHEEHGENVIVDPHIWLDPRNGAAMARAIANVLADRDPVRAADYRRNAEDFAVRLSVIEQQISIRLADVRTTPYIVFHDAYQYFEARFGLSPTGSVTVAADRPVGTRRIIDMRARIEDSAIGCIFSPPQFSPRLIATLTENADTRTGTLDDLGTDIAAGPALYEVLLLRLTDDFLVCLAA